MDIQIHLQNNTHIRLDNIKFQKMLLMYNALEKGWTVRKNDDSYIFTKNHEGKKEVLLDSYLVEFIQNNLDIENLLQ